VTAFSRRLDSPAFARNVQPILAVLHRVLADRTGHVLEIGSGPGQHIAAFAAAMPGLTWWPSDPGPRHLESIDGWREDCGCANLMRPVPLDATAADWPLGRPGFPPNGDFAAMLCINVVHIAPWAVAEGVLRAAGRLLAPGGRMILYGPYSRDGRHTAPSNAAFDTALRAQDPAWGVRDMADIATLARSKGMEIAETIEMPSNNFCLVLQRSERPHPGEKSA
jgi:SAM-dependent methyltransferase